MKLAPFNSYKKLNEVFENTEDYDNISLFEDLASVKKDILSAVDINTDEKLLNRLFSVLAEKTLEKALEYLNSKRKSSFTKKDLADLLNMVERADSDFQDKMTFIYKSANVGTLDIHKLLNTSRRAVVKFEMFTDKTNKTLKSIYIDLMNWKANLGSGSSTGSGEGFMITTAKSTYKGAVGDVGLTGFGDIEIKGNAARWHSARGGYTQMKDAFKKFHEKFIDIAPSAEKDRGRASKIYTLTVKGLNEVAKVCRADNITAAQIGGIYAEAMKIPFNATDAMVYKLRKGDFYNNGNIDSIKFRAAYGYLLFNAYSKKDGFKSILILDDKKLTAYSVHSADDVYNGIVSGKIKSTFAAFMGGTDSRSISPNYSVGK